MPWIVPAVVCAVALWLAGIGALATQPALAQAQLVLEYPSVPLLQQGTQVRIAPKIEGPVTHIQIQSGDLPAGLRFEDRRGGILVMRNNFEMVARTTGVIEGMPLEASVESVTVSMIACNTLPLEGGCVETSIVFPPVRADTRAPRVKWKLPAEIWWLERIRPVPPITADTDIASCRVVQGAVSSGGDPRLPGLLNVHPNSCIIKGKARRLETPDPMTVTIEVCDNIGNCALTDVVFPPIRVRPEDMAFYYGPKPESIYSPLTSQTVVLSAILGVVVALAGMTIVVWFKKKRSGPQRQEP